MNIGRRQHGPGLLTPVPVAQPFLNSRLASGEFAVCTIVHSKRLLACDGSTTTQTASDAERQAFGAFFAALPEKVRAITLV
jgi:hypothetical protein